MKLSIRLQQKGKKNHPYWWIVVAPARKNIFGRYVEHVGIWSPREGKHMKRQIILNIPRIKYWIAQGAVPTFKIHKFLSMWNIFPSQWYYKKSAQELAKIPQKPEEQLTEKEKFLKQRKRKRDARLELHPNNYHRIQSKATQVKKTQQLVLAKQKAQDFENDIIREMLYKTDFQKYDRIAELSHSNNDFTTPIRQKMKELKEKLQMSRSELSFLERQHKHTRTLQKVNLIKIINQIQNSLKEIQKSNQYTMQIFDDPQNKQEYMTQDYLQKRIRFELLSKKFKKMNEDINKFNEYNETITLDEFANYLKWHIQEKSLGKGYHEKLYQENFDFQDLKNKQNQEDSEQNSKEKVSQKRDKKEKLKKFRFRNNQIYILAQQIFAERIKGGAPLTRFDILELVDPEFMERLTANPDHTADLFTENGQLQKKIRDADEKTFFIKYMLNKMTYVPTLRPVHPRPDFKNYYPQQYYEPLQNEAPLKQIKWDPLDPYEEVLKYHKKKENKKMEQLL